MLTLTIWLSQQTIYDATWNNFHNCHTVFQLSTFIFSTFVIHHALSIIRHSTFADNIQNSSNIMHLSNLALGHSDRRFTYLKAISNNLILFSFSLTENFDKKPKKHILRLIPYIWSPINTVILPKKRLDRPPNCPFLQNCL